MDSETGKPSTKYPNNSKGSLTPADGPVDPDFPMISEGDVVPSKSRRWGILAVLILSLYIDVMCSSGFFVFTGPISRDLAMLPDQQSWVVTSFTVTFAAFLLFWGRVSDLYSPRPVFLYGFITFASLNLILSFMINQYAYLILRAIAGIAASALVPSAYRLIANVFPDEERARAYTLYGMTGSISNSTAVIIAGAIGAIEGTGQMSNWRWFFRLAAAISFPGALSAFVLIPRMSSSHSTGKVKEPRWKCFDLIGVLSMLTAILLIIVALTSGATYGFNSASFIAPIIIGLGFLPFFFWWESRLAEHEALIPSSTWRIPNLAVLIALGLVILGWWAVNFIPFIEMFAYVHGEPILIAAIRTLPEGIAAMTISFVLLVWPNICARPKWPIVIAMSLAGAALVLWTQATSIVGEEYWMFVFPGMIIGSTGMQIALLATIVGVMQAAPREKAGVVGAILQTSMHTSTVIALAIQSGLLTVQPGGLENYANIKASWYFELGWVVVWLMGFVILYRPSNTPADLSDAVA